MARFLVYFALGGVENPSYVVCLRAALRAAAAKFSASVDLAVICPAADWAALAWSPAAEGRAVSHHPLPAAEAGAAGTWADPVRVPYAAKLTAFRAIPDIARYAAVMYLDSDVLAGCDVADLLEAAAAHPRAPTCLFVATEAGHELDGPYHSLPAAPYPPAALAELKSEGAAPFNSGAFCLVPTDAVKRHLDAVLSFMGAYRGRAFFDQPFLNVYLHTARAAVPLLPPERYVLFPKRGVDYGAALVHFCGTGTPVHVKAAAMLEYQDAFLTGKAAAT